MASYHGERYRCAAPFFMAEGRPDGGAALQPLRQQRLRTSLLLRHLTAQLVTRRTERRLDGVHVLAAARSLGKRYGHIGRCAGRREGGGGLGEGWRGSAGRGTWAQILNTASLITAVAAATAAATAAASTAVPIKQGAVQAFLNLGCGLSFDGFCGLGKALHDMLMALKGCGKRARLALQFG